MTKTEVSTLIAEELKRALGRNGTGEYLQLRESREARERQEARDREHRKEAKRERKEAKRDLKESTRVFRSLGMTKDEARAAAQGRPESFRG